MAYYNDQPPGSYPTYDDEQQGPICRTATSQDSHGESVYEEDIDTALDVPGRTPSATGNAAEIEETLFSRALRNQPFNSFSTNHAQPPTCSLIAKPERAPYTVPDTSFCFMPVNNKASFSLKQIPTKNIQFEPRVEQDQGQGSGHEILKPPSQAVRYEQWLTRAPCLADWIHGI